MDKLVGKLKNNRLYYIFICIIFVLGAFLRINLFVTNPSMHGDALSLVLNIENRGFLELFQTLSYNQVAPPIFLIIAKAIVSIFGEKDYIYRLPSIISGLSALMLFPIFANKFLKSKILIVVAYTLFSINYMNILYSVIFKQYSTELLFSMLSSIIIISLYERFLEDKPVNNFKWVILSILTGCFIWVSYCSAIILIAGVIAITVYSRQIKAFLPLVISMGINLLMFTLLLYFNFKGYNFQDWPANTTFFHFCIKDIALFFHSIFNYLVGEVLLFFDYANNFLYKKDYFLLILILLGMFSFKQKNHLFLVLPVVLTWTASYFHLIVAIGRTMLFVIPFCYVLLVYILDNFDKKIQIGISILLVLSFTSAMSGTFYHYLSRDVHFYNYTKDFLSQIYEENPHALIYTITATNEDFSPHFYNRTNFNSQFNIKKLENINSELTRPCYIMKYDSLFVENANKLLRQLKNVKQKYQAPFKQVFLLYLE